MPHEPQATLDLSTPDTGGFQHTPDGWTIRVRPSTRLAAQGYWEALIRRTNGAAFRSHLLLFAQTYTGLRHDETDGFTVFCPTEQQARSWCEHFIGVNDIAMAVVDHSHLDDAVWAQLVRRHANGLMICSCGTAYQSPTRSCMDRCSPDKSERRRHVLAGIERDSLGALPSHRGAYVRCGRINDGLNDNPSYRDAHGAGLLPVGQSGIM